MKNLFTQVQLTHKRLGLADFLSAYSVCARSTRHQVIKVEAGQDFREPGSKSYSRFMAGDYDAAVKLIPQERLADREDYLANCKKGIWDLRLRLVIRPLTQYLQWEFETYKCSARWGERICVIDITGEERRRRFGEVADFLLFDDQEVLLNWYDNGEFRGGWHVTEPNLVSQCVKMAELLRTESIPLALFEWEHGL